MGSKLLWTGLTFLTAGSILNFGIPALAIVGAVIMIIGLILIWLDK